MARIKGTYCEVCQETHPLSKARGAVPASCQSCDVLTTDIHLIPLQHEIDNKPTIALVLLCSPCIRRGVKVQIENGMATVEKAKVA